MTEEGLDDALNHRKHSLQAHSCALDGEQEAHLIALSCSPGPVGQARWTLRLLAGRMVELGYVEQVSYETVRKTLKKTNSNPGSNNAGASRLRPALPLCGAWKMC